MTLKAVAALALAVLLLTVGGCAPEPREGWWGDAPDFEHRDAGDEPLLGTLILVRHAERDDAAADGLLPMGRERAALLAQVLGDAIVDVVLTSDQVRTMSTAGEIIASNAKKEPPLVVERFKSRDDGQDAAAKIRFYLAKDRVVLAIAHSNQVHNVLKALGGWDVAPLGEKDFGFLFVAEFRGERPPVLIRAGYPPSGR